MEFYNHKRKSFIKSLLGMAGFYFPGAVGLYYDTSRKHDSLIDNLDLPEYMLWTILFFIVFMIPLTLVYMAYDEKIVIQDGILRLYRKQIKRYKEIQNLLLSEIAFIQYKPRYDQKEAADIGYDYLNEAFWLVDNYGKERFRLPVVIANDEGVKVFEYLTNTLGIEVKKGAYKIKRIDRFNDFLDKIVTPILILILIAIVGFAVWVNIR